MGKDDWALLLSIGSLIVAAAAFVWNIWAKFIYPKPRLRLTFWVAQVVQGAQRGPRFLSLDLANLGPSLVIISSAIVQDRRTHFLRKGRIGLINPIHDLREPELPMGPFAGGLPKSVNVGETFALYFPFEREGWLGEETIDRIGVRDTFGRFHWALNRDVTRAREAYRRHFGE
jgi:hypothetical protein